MKIKATDEEIEIRYANWVSMMIDLIDPQNLFIIGGRGVAKTTDILAKRSLRIIDDMPGAPFLFVADTYVNAFSNIIPYIIEGWKRNKFLENIHFVTDQAPPDHFAETPITPQDWKRTICTYNGCMFMIRSIDRPSANAGISTVHIFGDEAKYLSGKHIDNSFKTIRGNRIKFGHSHYYMGKTFTTDMPNASGGDDDWILGYKNQMDNKQIFFILQAALNVNDERWKLYKAQKAKASVAALANIQANIDRWEALLKKSRFYSTFFYTVSSFANIDILTFDYILNNRGDDYAEFKRSILSIQTNVERGNMFYSALSEKHFFQDGYDYEYYDQYGIKDNVRQTSAGLRYIKKDQALDAGMDVGKMMSMVIGQEQGATIYIFKNLYTLSPEWVRQLADKFITFFEPHKYKVLNLYYDRAANNYAEAGKDIATEIKKNIEYNDKGFATGWRVNLMSLGQGNISQQEEYTLCQALMGEKEKRLPLLRIDQFECKELKSSLELAEANTKVGPKGNKYIVKVKTSEKKRLADLPMGSTNMSDAFKYFICRRNYMNIIKNKTTESFT